MHTFFSREMPHSAAESPHIATIGNAGCLLVTRGDRSRKGMVHVHESRKFVLAKVFPYVLHISTALLSPMRPNPRARMRPEALIDTCSVKVQLYREGCQEQQRACTALGV